jgi:hypothetical protein
LSDLLESIAYEEIVCKNIEPQVLRDKILETKLLTIMSSFENGSGGRQAANIEKIAVARAGCGDTTACATEAQFEHRSLARRMSVTIQVYFACALLDLQKWE